MRRQYRENRKNIRRKGKIWIWILLIFFGFSCGKKFTAIEKNAFWAESGKCDERQLAEREQQSLDEMLKKYEVTETEENLQETESGDDPKNPKSDPKGGKEKDTEKKNASPNDSGAVAASGGAVEKKAKINREKLNDFDYICQNFYQVDNTTTIGADQLNKKALLGKDMTLKDDGKKEPQILVYHTHSQETYKGCKEGDASKSVVAVGERLTELLRGYGYRVLHHKGEYDSEDRDNAYTYALPELEKILKKHPSIQVIIDVHRDSVPEKSHLVTTVNGKKTAQIMFFNGLSHTTALGDIERLPNKNRGGNLAFSFQAQLAAAELYPGLTRHIYLKGYRYNMHLRPRTMLVEVGAQNNSFEEARNAMEPLSVILHQVLSGKNR